MDYDPNNVYVTGGFAGTTDEIIQWDAQKWGIPEDWIRAQAVAESWWRQDGLGDPEHGKTPQQMSAYPAYSHIDTDSVYASLGIVQAKWHPECEWNTAIACQGGGIEPLRHKSTAFNIDYLGASIRYYYDGKCYWCTRGYAAGQQWESLGAWFSSYPWSNSSTVSYIDKVRNHLAARTWEASVF